MDEPQAPLTEARAIIEAHRRADSLLTAHELGVLEAALASAPHPPSNTLGDALTGPGSTSLRSSDPYRGVPPAERLRWLHSPASHNVNGYEWGIFRVKWVNGQAAEVWQTNADFSDLDAAMGDPVASLPTPPIASAPAAERDE